MNQEFEERLENAAQLQKNILDEIVQLQTYTSMLRGQADLSVTGNQALEFASKNQRITELFQNVYTVLVGLVDDLNSLVNKWKSRFQLHYAKLMVEPDLEEISPWCAQTGKIIYELLHESIKAWKNVFLNNPSNDLMMLEMSFLTLFRGFFQSTFLVSKQQSFYVKTETKTFQTFSVRLLAADFLYGLSAEVKAHFISECNLKKCFHSDDLDLDMLKQKEIKLTVVKKQKSPSKHELKTEKGTDKMQCCLQNHKFEKKFERVQTRDMQQIPVHEEKFRIVFIFKMESKPYWALSLPLVVISASSQEANSLASIMWQCSSTNVYSLQDNPPEKLPWSTVAKILRQKMSLICESHNLTDENITHLKNRLFGVEGRPDEEPVSLTQFCCDAMQGVSFSFWKWFLGVFNLVDVYLRKYWSDGLIMGFVKREAAEEMLEACDTNGTFILRFRDSLMIERDGFKNVFGLLNATICWKKKNKNPNGTGSKRKSNGEPEVVEEKDIEHVNIEKCPPENLANILKDEPKPLYCYLYPSGKSRKETFDKYLKIDKEKKLFQIYRNARDLNMDDLEEGVKKMDVSGKNQCSISSEAGAGSQSGPRIVKKARRSKEKGESDTISTKCQENYSPVSTPNQSQLNLSQNSWAEQSPGFVEQSPSQSVPTDVFHLLGGGNQDSVVPNSPDKSGSATSSEDLNLGAKNENCQEILNKLPGEQSFDLGLLDNADADSFVSWLLDSGNTGKGDNTEGGDITAKSVDRAEVEGASDTLHETKGVAAYDTGVQVEKVGTLHNNINMVYNHSISPEDTLVSGVGTSALMNGVYLMGGAIMPGGGAIESPENDSVLVGDFNFGQSQDFQSELQHGNETTGNELMEPMSREFEYGSNLNGGQMDPDLSQLIEQARMLKKSKPEQYKMFLSLMSLREDVIAMETDYQNTAEDELALEDTGDEAGSSLDELFDMSMSPLQKIFNDEQHNQG